MYRLSVLFGLFFMSYSTATGAVLINEIAWMGTTESHLCNWIEFYNSGTSDVDIIDWSLYINDTQRVISDGEGSSTVIGAGEYWVLERKTDTCPNPVPERNDWYIVMGNLPNSGATISLRRGDGTIEDQVAGGENWQNIGGDNTTKDTAQRTDNGWVTATPTPGKSNISVSNSEEAVTDNGSSKRDERRIVSARVNTLQSLTVPDSQLQLSIESSAYAYVNQPIALTASSSGVVDVIESSLQYDWNFGDLHTSSGEQSLKHVYRYPGTYVVTLHAGYARHEQIARHVITVLPINLEISHIDDVVHIHNTSPYEVDVSGFTITGITSSVVPSNTWLLPNSTLSIPSKELGISSQRLISITDSQNQVVATNFDDIIRNTLFDAVESDNEEVSFEATVLDDVTSQANFYFDTNKDIDVISIHSNSEDYEDDSYAREHQERIRTSQTAGFYNGYRDGGSMVPYILLLLLLSITGFIVLYPRK